MAEYWALFLSSFISSTLFPGGSEVLVAYLANGNEQSPWLLWIFATSGNVLGGMSSYLVGVIWITLYPSSSFVERYHSAIERIKGIGAYALLLSWLPVIGDPLCVAAGWLRIHWLLSLLLIALGKGARYAIIIWLFN